MNINFKNWNLKFLFSYAEKVKFDTADVFGAIEDQENPNKEDLLDVSFVVLSILINKSLTKNSIPAEKQIPEPV